MSPACMVERVTEGKQIPDLMLEVANNAALRHLADRQNVANSQLRLLAAVNELTSVHALGGYEKLLLQTMLVAVAELNNGEGGTTTRIVNNVLDDTLHVSVALSKVERAELGSALPVLGVGLENGTTTPTASTDNTTLRGKKSREAVIPSSHSQVGWQHVNKPTHPTDAHMIHQQCS